MGITNPFKDQSLSLTKRLLPWTLYALLPIVLLRLYFYPLPFPPLHTASPSPFAALHRNCSWPPPSKFIFFLFFFFSYFFSSMTFFSWFLIFCFQYFFVFFFRYARDLYDSYKRTHFSPWRSLTPFIGRSTQDQILSS